MSMHTLQEKPSGNPQSYFIRAKIRENTYHFTNEWAGMPVKLGKLARYFGKLEFVGFFT